MATALVSCLVASLPLSSEALADVSWTERAGAWSVSRYVGERGDSWCGWTTTWTHPENGSGRSITFQMRGDETILFLFVEGTVPEGLSTGSELALAVDGTRGTFEADLVRRLPSGFLMARGVLAADAEERDRLVAMLSQAYSVELTLPDGGTWPLDVTGLVQTGPSLLRCLADVAMPVPSP